MYNFSCAIQGTTLKQSKGYLMKKDSIIDWLIRFIKGMIIGTGAILPGVSGGALAAVFGIYERMIAFLANMRKDFVKNVIFFIPVGIGGLVGVWLLNKPLNYFLKTAEIQVLWCFVGCIIGTLPALYREAGKQGRKNKHLVITIVTAVLAFAGLWLARQYMNVEMPLNFGTWIMAGAIFAFGFIVPGLSPSNFLMYFNMYEPLTDGISKLDLKMLIPFGIGALLCVICFAKLVSLIMKKAYAAVFHFILGIVIASTAIIIPMDYSGATAGVLLVSLVVFVVGLAVGLFMGRLEAKYKHE